MKTITCTILICLLFCCTSNSQTEKESSIEAINAKFFSSYSTDSNSALDYLFSTNKWINKTDVAGLKEKLNSTTSQLGVYIGEELITSKSIGKNYILYSYMVKYERQPIKFLLTYYRPKDHWQLQNFQFNPDLETELVEAAKAYSLIENLDLDDGK